MVPLFRWILLVLAIFFFVYQKLEKYFVWYDLRLHSFVVKYNFYSILVLISIKKTSFF